MNEIAYSGTCIIPGCNDAGAGKRPTEGSAGLVLKVSHTRAEWYLHKPSGFLYEDAFHQPQMQQVELDSRPIASFLPGIFSLVQLLPVGAYGNFSELQLFPALTGAHTIEWTSRGKTKHTRGAD